ncbi:MAG TPA: hypothetical protein VNF91_04130, partial [Candidatus Acidoferrum sp.]|nr:hypothetical protein [Candidatus Acidoferrum sp.]
PEAITPAVLVTATQLTVELDQTRLPLNRKSTNKEPGTWAPYLSQQGVPGSVLAALRSGASDNTMVTMRAKRAAACLLWMSDWPISKIERTLTQYIPGNDAAGDVRSVVNRTLDLVPTAIEVGAILHSGLALGDRQADLLARLQLGLPASLARLGRLAGANLTRAEYLALGRAGLAELDALAVATDEEIAAALGADKQRVRIVREALRRLPPETEPVEFPPYDEGIESAT